MYIFTPPSTSQKGQSPTPNILQRNVEKFWAKPRWFPKAMKHIYWMYNPRVCCYYSLNSSESYHQHLLFSVMSHSLRIKLTAVVKEKLLHESPIHYSWERLDQKLSLKHREIINTIKVGCYFIFCFLEK